MFLQEVLALGESREAPKAGRHMGGSRAQQAPGASVAGALVEQPSQQL